MNDGRARALGLVETYLRRQHLDLPRLRLIAQSHYASSGFAFIDVFGVDNDTMRRRSIRTETAKLFQDMGYAVELERGRDVYDLDPERPRSKHEELAFLSAFRRRF